MAPGRRRTSASIAALLLLAPPAVPARGGGEAAAGAPRVAKVEVTAGTSRLTVGQTTQASAEPRDEGGRLVPAAPVTWTSDSGSVASVDARGVVTANSAGTATITATCGDAKGSMSVTVQPLQQRQPARRR